MSEKPRLDMNKIAKTLGAVQLGSVQELLEKLRGIKNDAMLPQSVRDAAEKEFLKINYARNPLS